MPQLKDGGSPQEHAMRFTSDAMTLLTLAQNEASERGQSVRPIHLLLAAVRMEKTISGLVLESTGVTRSKITAFMDAKGEKRNELPTRKIGFDGATMVTLDAAVELATQRNHRFIGIAELAGTLAESKDTEVQEALSYCGTTGEAIMHSLMLRMRELE